jgi:serine/threonine protein kinase
MIGRVLKGIYRIYDRVGTGGFATVYLGRKLDTNEVVAIKILKQEHTGNPRFVERFRREAEMASRLCHDNIVRILDHGVEDSVHFLVMEYVEGKTLAEILDQQRHLPVADAVAIARQVCSALQIAHRAGVVHRDITPHNIMVTPAGIVKVMDFGIARMQSMDRLTQTGTFLGTLRYLSPERVQGERVDIRSDLYALGIVLYEMLVGDAPFSGDNAWAVLHHQMETAPPRVRSRRQEVPAWLDEVVARALAKMPEDRFQNPAELLAALKLQAGKTPNIGRLVQTPVLSTEIRRRILRPVAIGSVLAIVLLALVLGPARLNSLRRSQSVAPATLMAAPVTVTLAPTWTLFPSDTATAPAPTATESPRPSDTPLVVVTPSVVTPRPTRTATATFTATPLPTPIPATPTAAPALTAAPPATVEPAPTPPPVSSSDVPGGRIAFSVIEPGSGKYILYSARLDGSELRHLGNDLRQPGYRQDGLLIAANGQGAGMNDLWEVDPKNGVTSRYFGFPEDEHPTWLQSKKGYHVCFDSTRHGDGAWRLYVGDTPISYGSGELRGRYPVWLPGESVAYCGCDYGFGTGSKCGLYRVSMWGGIPRQLTGNPNDIPTGGGDAGVLFMRQVDGNWDVYLVAGTGGDPRRLTDNAASDGLATFSPDGKTIAFLSSRSGSWSLWLMNADGGAQHKAFDLPAGGGYGPEWMAERLSWGPIPVGPTPVSTREGGEPLPAPAITFPIPADTVSTKHPTTVYWTWERKLATGQGFQVRLWHSSSNTPFGVDAPTTGQQLTFNVHMTEPYLIHGEGTYYLDVVVVEIGSGRVLSNSSPITVKTDPSKP